MMAGSVMDERSASEYRLTGMTHSALLKPTSEASPLILPSQHLVPPMLPSLDAYLDAYRSLMSQDVQAMSALGACGGLGIRPPGYSMPVLPTAAAAAAAAASLAASPYYGMSPYSVGDLARYGLLSPVYVPPFIAPLLCGGVGGVSGLLPTPEPPQASPEARLSGERDTIGCQPQSFAKSLLEACTAARKSDTSATAAGHSRPPLDVGAKPVRRDPHFVDRTKQTQLEPSARSAATTELLSCSSDRKWNSSSVVSSKMDRLEMASQSAAAVDCSAHSATDISGKAAVPGCGASSDNRKFNSTTGAPLSAGKTAADHSTHSAGNYFYGSLSTKNSQNASSFQDLGDRKKYEKAEADNLKGARNGDVQRDVGVKAVADTSKVAPVISGEHTKHRTNSAIHDDSKLNHQSDVTSGLNRVTSLESDSFRIAATDVVGLGSRRLSRPGAKKRPAPGSGPAEPAVALAAGGDTATSAESDSKSRNGMASSSSSVEEFRCRLCNYSGRSQHCLSKHYRAHDLAYKICRYCRRAFERPSDLLRHEERHRRRDVLGSGVSGGSGLIDAADGGVSYSADEIPQQPAVGRVDTFADGAVSSSNLVSARLGAGDNEVILSFDEPAADALVDQPTAPTPSKLRDVYSIMAGIFVNQHFYSFGQSATAVSGSEPSASRAGTFDDRSGAIVTDFGQQAFMQMLDLKMVSETGSPEGSAAYGSAAGLIVQPRGAVTSITATSSVRERRRKGIPNRAIGLTLPSTDATDTNAQVVAFCDASPDIMSDAIKLRRSCVADDTADEVSSTFIACNGSVSTAAVKLGPESDSVRLHGYPRDSAEMSTSGSPHEKRRLKKRCRKAFTISCKVCGKRLVEGSELDRHWLRHSVQDADGCYSCASCSFTSNVRLIMRSHSHIHLVRSRRSTAQPAATGPRCRLCAKRRRHRRRCLEQTGEDGGLVKSLWCSHCARRRAMRRLIQLDWRHRRPVCFKSVHRLPKRQATSCDQAQAGNCIDNPDLVDICRSSDNCCT